MVESRRVDEWDFECYLVASMKLEVLGLMPGVWDLSSGRKGICPWRKTSADDTDAYRSGGRWEFLSIISAVLFIGNRDRGGYVGGSVLITNLQAQFLDFWIDLNVYALCSHVSGSLITPGDLVCALRLRHALPASKP